MTAVDNGSVPASIDQLLKLHRCAGARQLVSTAHCIDTECFGDGTRLTDVHALVDRDVVAVNVDVQAVGTTCALPTVVVVGARQVSFDDGERSLAALLEDDGADAVAIVTYDEDAFDVLMELLETDVIRVLPITSVSLLANMYDCGALDEELLINICEAALHDLETRQVNMSVLKRERKIRQVEEILNRLAIRPPTQQGDTR